MLPHTSLDKLQALNFMMTYSSSQYEVQIASKADKEMNRQSGKQKGSGNDQQNEE